MNKFVKLVISILCTSAIVSGHHGLGGNYGSQSVTLTGIVRECSYANPHVIAKIEVEDKLWEVTLPAPSALRQAGLSQDILKPGVEANFWGSVHRTKQNDMYASGIAVGDLIFGRK